MEAANIIFMSLIRDFPDSIDVHMEFFSVLKKLKRTKQAQQLLIDFVDTTNTDDHRILSRLASTYMATEDYDKALEIIAKAKPRYLENGKLNDDYPLGFLFLEGSALTSLERYDEAQTVFEQNSCQST